ncbi:MAG: hypothetical protein RML46_07490 [Anaerolineae bacterium]|nr:hypothetical protein [Anaerolineae bacterium]MDW8068739.1 hypothetical protein [Anaerolineae bacterium]
MKHLSDLSLTFLIILIAPSEFAVLLFSQMEQYLALSLAALVLGLAALVGLIVTERRTALRRAPFWALILALGAVVAAPLLVSYEPAVRAAPGWTLRMVEPPGLIDGFVRACQAGAEVRGECQYEPLGWADEETLVYRKWCDGQFQVDVANARSEGDPGIAGPPLAYSVTTGRVAPFEGDLDSLYRQTCPPNQCVMSGLAAQAGFPPPSYFSGYFGDPLPSSDGRRVAFTARHVYGPEDLLVLEGP